VIAEHDRIVLTQDVPEEGLTAGDVGTVVHVYPQGVAYEVEFITLHGETVAIVTLEARQVRPIRPADMPHVREREPLAA
jgi:hypothetical protein